jgi:hypothetical protein
MRTTYEGKVYNLNPELIEKLGEDKRKNSSLPVLGSTDYEDSLLKMINANIRLMLGLKDNDSLYGDIIIPDRYIEYKYSSDSHEVLAVKPEEFHNIFVSAVKKAAKELGLPYSENSEKKVLLQNRDFSSEK